MDVAVSAARWVVGKALGPVSDGLLEAWAASKDLGSNIDALKTELLYVQGMLNNIRGREIDNPPLNQLLQKLQQLAYRADDVLDELDYFRIQDGLYGTYEAADEHAKGCLCNLFLNTHHTTKAVGKLLGCSAYSCAAANPRGAEEPRSQEVRCCAWPCARRSARGSTPLIPNTDQADAEASGCIRKLASGALNSVRTVGKLLPCSSFPSVHDDGSGKSVMCCACMRKAPHRKCAKEAPKLEFDRVALSRRMKYIVEQLQPLCAKVTAILNLELLGSSRATNPRIVKKPPTTTSDIIEPTLYGRDPTKNSIINSITQDEYSTKDFTVMPIVGPGGIGKTTLVQYIYHNQEVQSHFQVKVWICVSQNFNVSRLIEEIEKYVPPVKDEKSGRPEELIEQRLKSKRLLLILDDIWKCEYEDWRRLLVPFTKGQAKGNVIVVTTRFPAVAEMVKTTNSSLDLEGLDPEVFRELFLACVFDDEQSRKDHSGLIEIGYKIAEKLKGSPLAAKTVGRLLRNHLDLYYWTRVLESREWEMQTGEHDIMPALKLSYDYLPFHLQQCFSSCALFPEDYKFDGEELIHFWIGLDIIHSGGQNMTIEEIGLSSLNDLVNHGFLKKDETDGHPHYIIHDLLHDLALKVASHECITVQRSNVRSVEIRSSVRHLSIIIDSIDDNDAMTDESFRTELRKLKTRLMVENLHSLIIFGELFESFAHIFSDLFGEANALRVLCFPKLQYSVEAMLHNFPALIHLRYLRLGTMSGSEILLPATLSRFYHLRILHLEEWHGCLDLSRDMSNLSKLRHFLTKNDELHSVISNVGKLQFLQELRKFEVDKETNGFELKQLCHLMELRRLGIYNLERISTKEEAAVVKLNDKKHLHKLKLYWESSTEGDVGELVLQYLRPHNCLQELHIRGHVGHSCPTWLGNELSVKALKSLHLVGVSWKNLPSMGLMFVLHELHLEDIDSLREFGPNTFGLITEQTFCSLKKLALIGLKRLEKWFTGETCKLFSGLQILVIRDCPELVELPLMNNIHGLPNLQVFQISNCPKVLSLPPIPWTRTLCSIKINDVGSNLAYLNYSKSSFEVRLEITGKDDVQINEKVLVFNNLTELNYLNIKNCPPLDLKHIQMLTSLTSLIVNTAKSVFANMGHDKWQLPVQDLSTWNCDASGKDLAHLFSHLPELSSLSIIICQKMTRLGVEAEQQRTKESISSPSSSVVKMEDTPAINQIAGEVEEEEGVAELTAEQEREEDGLLLFPSHLADSLQVLKICGCPELTLAAPPSLPNDHSTGEGQGRDEGLQALRSLQTLVIEGCPKLLSAYKTTSSSSCYPFPSSLQDLALIGDPVEGMETLESLSNLTSLTRLCITAYGCEGLWPLIARGQLCQLEVFQCPKLFVGWDLSVSTKLQELMIDDVATVLVAPICAMLSSSLTKLSFVWDEEAKSFTKEQEEALHLLTSLQELQFDECNKLQHLPAGLNKLTNLKILKISGCSGIRLLPKDGLPNSLQELNVSNCHSEELTRECRRLLGTIQTIRL